jgi:dTDP-4-dehydrorhamnose reductase
MRLLVTGKNGQIGWELGRALAPLGEVTSCDRTRLDLSNPDLLVSVVRSVRPDVIVNAAAYTAVDRAESDRKAAFAVNAAAPGILAAEAKRCGALLVHYSTDYVFDGTKQGPYLESDPTCPINVYGESKLAGETAIGESGARSIVLRTSWVYAARGANFLLTILRLARQKPELSVVDDQVGAPTSAPAIADATARIVAAATTGDSATGVYHLTAAGATSWCGFAQAIVASSGAATRVRPIPSAQYPTAAARPKNSLLDNDKLRRDYGIVLADWRAGLAGCLSELGPSIGGG